MHALGQRDDWTDLRVFGALLVGMFDVFTQPGVQLRSGFFGPIERALPRVHQVLRPVLKTVAVRIPLSSSRRRPWPRLPFYAYAGHRSSPSFFDSANAC